LDSVVWVGKKNLEGKKVRISVWVGKKVRFSVLHVEKKK
jgi:hypothetical protein